MNLSTDRLDVQKGERIRATLVGVYGLLAKDGTSTVTGTYSPRGHLQSVGGSYGPLISSTVVQADGRPVSVTYADKELEHTSINYFYNDPRSRLSEVSISRGSSFPKQYALYRPRPSVSAREPPSWGP